MFDLSGSSTGAPLSFTRNTTNLALFSASCVLVGTSPLRVRPHEFLVGKQPMFTQPHFAVWTE